MDDSERTLGTTALARVLVVDPDPMFGLLVEACIDFAGAAVLTASTVAEAAEQIGPELAGLVLEPGLADGDGMDLLQLVEQRCPTVAVVVCVDATGEPGPVPAQWPGARVTAVDKADLARMIHVLGLAAEPDHLPDDHLLHISALDLDSI